MAGQGESGWSRREFLRGPTLAGTAVILGLKSESAAAEPPLETTRIRIHDAPITCFAPVYIAEGLLKAEGFTDVQYIKTPLNEGPTKALAEGKIDITQNDTAGHLMELDAGAPVVVLGGIHTGCWELFANDSIRTPRDLKGKTIAAPERSSRQAYVAGLATFFGLDPLKDITWINHEPGKSMQLFAEGKIDAFMGFAPEPQELRAKKIGHVLIDFGKDRPCRGQRNFGSALVAVLLLHGCRESRIHAQAPGRDQAGPAGHAEGYRPLREPAGAGSSPDGRQGRRGQVRVRPAVSQRDRFPVARVRIRGHRAVLGLASAGGGHHQVEPQQDHRAGN